MLNPAFSAGHMRDLLPMFYEVTARLRTAIASRVTSGSQELDMLGWMGRTALELIGQGGFGYSFDPLVDDASDEFGEALKSAFSLAYSMGLLRYLLPLLTKLGPPGFRRRLVDFVPNRRLQRLKITVDLIHRRSTEIFNEKKATLLKGDEAVSQRLGKGKDIISILMTANMEAKSDENQLPEEELIAHISGLTAAAVDTTSNTLAHILQLLAQHPDAQAKLREEIVQARGEDEFSYDQLMQLPYLDAVCRETLRAYPPVTIVDRQTRKDIVLPLSEPIRGIDGETMSDILVPNGTHVFIGVEGCNLSKTLWGKDALEWKPERWLLPLSSTVSDAHIPGVYSNLLSFLGGGRACIGFKFSELEMKVVLSVLLPTFTFELTDKPIVWNVSGIGFPTVGNVSTKAELPLKVGLFAK
ncbi:cytochrome P450 [Sparassis latifolia]